MSDDWWAIACILLLGACVCLNGKRMDRHEEEIESLRSRVAWLEKQVMPQAECEAATMPNTSLWQSELRLPAEWGAK